MILSEAASISVQYRRKHRVYSGIAEYTTLDITIIAYHCCISHRIHNIWYIYLHLVGFFSVSVVGKYTIHGSVWVLLSAAIITYH